MNVTRTKPTQLSKSVGVHKRQPVIDLALVLSAPGKQRNSASFTAKHRSGWPPAKCIHYASSSLELSRGISEPLLSVKRPVCA
jgi:hypothetical protein